jgi:hypothetical protein
MECIVAFAPGLHHPSIGAHYGALLETDSHKSGLVADLSSRCAAGFLSNINALPRSFVHRQDNLSTPFALFRFQRFRSTF